MNNQTQKSPELSRLKSMVELHELRRFQTRLIHISTATRCETGSNSVRISISAEFPEFKYRIFPTRANGCFTQNLNEKTPC